ncbi:MAG: cysteine--tRNA ligase [Gemmatimonadales bacterium]
MTLRLYNTLSREVEPFAPLAPPRVTVYSCGPTVWNYAHIGNFRTFIFVDLLRRWLEASGFSVFHVMNLTDVDDRIIKEATAKGVGIDALVSPYIDAFREDCEYLRIRPAHAQPRATEFVPSMVALVQGLLDKGVAYRGEDGSVYFAIQRFPAYGRLSRLDTRELKTGGSGRVSSDEYSKENAQDFVLWKAVRPEDETVGAAWDAPFGRGRPGWHLECSAMALSLIGEKYGAKVLDIHTGGVDLIFPHHEDEIAQSCAYTGESAFARFWLHGEFLQIRGAKMSKRFGNIVTARALREDGVDPGAIRLLICQAHYRQPLDLTDEALEAAREGSRRLGELDRRLGDRPGASDELASLAKDTDAKVAAALDDDLNVPRAMGQVFEFVRDANRLLDRGEKADPAAVSLWERWTRTLFDVLPSAREADADLIARVEALLAERAAAKKRRDFARADTIRSELLALGVVVEDTPAGTKWRLA